MRRLTASAIFAFIATVIGTSAVAQSVPAVRITAHTESGAAIAGASIRIEREGGVSSTVVTDPNGEAVIRGLAAGAYKILISAQVYEPTGQTLTIQDERQQVEIDF